MIGRLMRRIPFGLIAWVPLPWRFVLEARWRDFREDFVYRVLPLDVRLSVMFRQMGELTVTDERLHAREVPTITVDEFSQAAKVAQT